MNICDIIRLRNISYFFILFGWYSCFLSLKVSRERNIAHNAAVYELVNGKDKLLMEFTLDGNIKTCPSTSEKKAIVYIELNDTYSISKISIRPEPGASLHHSDTIYVGTSPYDSEGVLCNFGPSEDEQVTERRCFGGVRSGNFVKLTSLYNNLKLCGVEIYECEDGYYGSNCTTVCHCDRSQPCHKVEGTCPDDLCAPGWNGTDCQDECPSGRYGRNCKGLCHCVEGIECHAKDGNCNGSLCSPGWYGFTCQTVLPKINSHPMLYSETDTSLTVTWQCWEQFIEKDLVLSYIVLFRPSGSRGTGIHGEERIQEDEDLIESTHSDIMTTGSAITADDVVASRIKQGWIVGSEVNHIEGRYNYQAVIRNLMHNIFYEFIAIPRLTLPDSRVAYGEATQPSPFFRTKCKAPEMPEIRNISTSVVNNCPIITISWTKLTVEESNCESILYYDIYYEDFLQPLNLRNWMKLSVWSHDEIKNLPDVQYDTNYRVKICAINNYQLESCSELVKTRTDEAPTPTYNRQSSNPTNQEAGVIAGIVVCLLTIGLVISIVFVYRQKKKNQFNKSFKREESQVGLTDYSHSSELDDLLSQIIIRPSSMHAGNNNNFFGTDISPEKVRQLENAWKLNADNLPMAMSMDEIKLIGNPIAKDSFVAFVEEKKMENYKSLKMEFAGIPTENPEASKRIGKHFDNIAKNRFKDVIAYDQTRVELKSEGESYYINANYIDGYKTRNVYIATQGCKKTTIIDFWNMVWQEESRRVVMVTNLIEKSNIKCHQYWPDEEGTSRHYGDLTVTLKDVIKMTYFTIRSLEVTGYGVKREIKQFHFTSWPDHGVPSKLDQILTFRNKVRSCDLSHPGIIVVHCSAGIGRTGAFIALDTLIDHLENENYADVMKTTTTMRMQRCNMIQRPEQYIFVYRALAEHLKVGNTAVSCSEFKSYYQSLIKCQKNSKSGLQKQFELLESLVSESTTAMTANTRTTTINTDESCTALQPENRDKNRYSTIVPNDKCRPYLTTVIEGTNDYINALYLDGYRSRNAYVLTQMPLPATVIDFWRLVFEHESRSIVMLNLFNTHSHRTYGQYWPEAGEESECGPFLIQSLDVRVENNISIRQLQLSCIAEVLMNSSVRSRYDPSPRKVTLFHMSSLEHNYFLSPTSFPKSKSSSSQLNDLVRHVGADLSHLIELVDEEMSKIDIDLPIVVHCDDGQTLSGLFVAISCIREKMRVEGEVDIFQTIRNLKVSRQGIVPSLSQFQFCYEMVAYFFNAN